jgi:hypothetical protein
MKVTLPIPDPLLRQLEREAAHQGRTVSELVEAALCVYFEQQKCELPPLPSFDMREALVDISDREALYDAMDGPELRKMYGTPDTK